MSILFPEGSNNFILSLKFIFISTTVLSAAVAFKLSAPAIADFAVTDVPSLYNGVVSWLKPPYLYLVINCIIVTIFASSKLKLHHHPADVSTTVPLPIHPQLIQSTQVQVVGYYQPQTQTLPLDVHHIDAVNYKPHGFSDNDQLVGAAVTSVTPPPEVLQYVDDMKVNNVESDYFGNKKQVLEEKEGVVGANEVADALPEAVELRSGGYGEESLVMPSKKSSRSPPSTSPRISRTDSLEFSLYSNEKPPVSARFGHRRAAKASPEQGAKAALGVSKPKRQDTLESTWKTITEGRAMPLTRHLRKADTWESHGGRHHHNQAPQDHQITKSQTFTDRSKTDANNRTNIRGSSSNNSLLSPSPGSGKLKREPSLGQDELNRRVEAFIKKFNEEMRLQRQESLNQYKEMINRGAH